MSIERVKKASCGRAGVNMRKLLRVIYVLGRVRCLSGGSHSTLCLGPAEGQTWSGRIIEQHSRIFFHMRGLRASAALIVIIF